MKYLSLDTRALGLMRISIAAVLILDLAIRLSDLTVFYTDRGVAPLHMIFLHTWNDYFISIHTISGRWEVQLALFLIALFCALMLLIGYRTRVFTILSWFLLLSLHNRNDLILQGGDDLLRMTLFWCMFLPWGASYSYDALHTEPPSVPLQIRTPATLAYILQVSSVYTGSALLKGPEWHSDGTALYYVYSLDQISYPVTKYLYHYPEMLRYLSYSAWYFELLVPVLFFIPWKHSFFRATGVLLILLFHLANGFTLLIGLFFIIGMTTCLGVLPSPVMDRLERSAVALRKRASESFSGIGYAVNYVIPWRPAHYMLSSFARYVQTFVMIFLLLYVFDWNLSNLRSVSYKLGPQARSLGYFLRLDQSWGMFAPGVFKEDGWYILEGITETGESVDLLRGGKPVSYEKPANIVFGFKNDRWRKYTENLLLNYNDFARGYYCQYSKRVWNERHPDKRLKMVRIIYMLEFSEKDYAYSIPQKQILFECE